MWVWIFQFWKKRQFCKFQKIDQSYTIARIKVTNIKDINIKILCFFIHAFPHMFFVPKKTPKQCQFIFICNNYIKFIYTLGNFDRPIKVTSNAIKVTPSAIKVTLFDQVTLIGLNFWFRISSKKLIVTYGKVQNLKLIMIMSYIQ